MKMTTETGRGQVEAKLSTLFKSYRAIRREVVRKEGTNKNFDITTTVSSTVAQIGKAQLSKITASVDEVSYCNIYQYSFNLYKKTSLLNDSEQDIFNFETDWSPTSSNLSLSFPFFLFSIYPALLRDLSFLFSLLGIGQLYIWHDYFS